MLPRGPMVWNLGRASQRSKDWILDVLPRGPRIEFSMCFPEVCGFEFVRASQRSDGLKFGRVSQRSDGLESWTCFPEVQRLNFGRVSQRSMDLNLYMLPRGLMD